MLNLFDQVLRSHVHGGMIHLHPWHARHLFFRLLVSWFLLLRRHRHLLFWLLVSWFLLLRHMHALVLGERGARTHDCEKYDYCELHGNVSPLAKVVDVKRHSFVPAVFANRGTKRAEEPRPE